MEEWEDGYVDEGSYRKGAIGAALGALAGAAVWAIALGIGYLFGLLGLVIGFAVGKGYSLMQGKQGKGRIPIQLLAAALGVVLGTVVGLCLSALINMQQTGVPMESFPAYMQMILSDPDVAVMIGLDVAQGIFCAAGAVVVWRMVEDRL